MLRIGSDLDPIDVQPQLQLLVNRRAKLLIHLATEGSLFDAYSHHDLFCLLSKVRPGEGARLRWSIP
jgi:hypothetical protein